ncbi:hypothetical protein Tco_0364303 [Tanacetum coccineum]
MMIKIFPDTRLEPRSDKESPEVEITNNEEVEITNVVIPVNVNEEEEEITDEVYELKRREKGKIVEESRNTPIPTPIRSPRIHKIIVSSNNTEKTPGIGPKVFLSRKSFDTLVDHLQEVMVESLLTMVDKYIKEQVEKQVPEHVKIQAKKKQLKITFRSFGVDRLNKRIATKIYSMKADTTLHQQDIAIWLALQMKFKTFQWCAKTSEYEAHVTRESSGQVNEKEKGQSSSRNQEQTDDYDFLAESYALDDDEILTKQRDVWASISIDHKRISRRVRIVLGRAKLNSWLLTFTKRPTPLVQSCQIDPEAPALSLINQDLFYLKKGSSGPEKIVLSLYKFPVIIFNDVDIEEQTSR